MNDGNALASPDYYFFHFARAAESEALALSISRAIRYLEMQLPYDGRRSR